MKKQEDGSSFACGRGRTFDPRMDGLGPLCFGKKETNSRGRELTKRRIRNHVDRKTKRAPV